MLQKGNVSLFSTLLYVFLYLGRKVCCEIFLPCEIIYPKVELFYVGKNEFRELALGPTRQKLYGKSIKFRNAVQFMQLCKIARYIRTLFSNFFTLKT